ncbi:MAG: hypothetical protein AB7J46_06685 [Candidatus Altimarinota bacterium]
MTTAAFPFKLEDLKSWTIKRADGTTTKYILSNAAIVKVEGKGGDVKQESTTAGKLYSYADYCTHTPTDTPVATFPRPKDGLDLRLWVANMGGARKTKDSFHFVVDCGDILTYYRTADSYLEGDPELKAILEPYAHELAKTRILKIDWDDRAAAPVMPQFWDELNKQLYGDVMTCCVGGHGRSGTAFVCLLLANAPDYDALDALVHCRAVHCPRAIESVAQHEYINSVAQYFGRTQNAKEAEKISNYKEVFMASKKPTAIRTRVELGWEK